MRERGWTVYQYGGEEWIVRWWVDSRGSGSVGWFAWRNCAAVEAARFSARERGVAMRRLQPAAALANGFSPRSNVLFLPTETCVSSSFYLHLLRLLFYFFVAFNFQAQFISRIRPRPRSYAFIFQ